MGISTGTGDRRGVKSGLCHLQALIFLSTSSLSLSISSYDMGEWPFLLPASDVWGFVLFLISGV